MSQGRTSLRAERCSKRKIDMARFSSLALAARGIRTLAVDLDLGLANLDVLFGVTVARDLRHVVEGRVTPAQCIVGVPGGFSLLDAAMQWGNAETGSKPLSMT